MNAVTYGLVAAGVIATLALGGTGPAQLGTSESTVRGTSGAGAPDPAVRVLARPDSDPGAEDGFTAPAAATTNVDTAHFRLHYVTETEDRADVDFVTQAGTVLEEVWQAEIAELGWPAPPHDDGLGGNDLIDVYFVELGAGAYGYTSPDEEALCANCGPPHGYLVLDNDYVGYAPDPGGALRATAAHEFAHLVQFGIAYLGEGWAYEATSVWLEQLVYPDVDARTQYLTDFAGGPTLPITDFDDASGGFDRSYGMYVWNLWLEHRYGPAVVLDAWLAAPEFDDHLLEGYDAALRTRGSSLAAEFVAFSAATTGWEVGGFPSELGQYPRVQRQALLSTDSVARVEIDHTAAYVADIEVDDTVTVIVRGPKFVSGGVALVAASGSTVLSSTDDTLFDGTATVTLSDLSGVDRVTLVVVNSDATLAVPKPPRSDRPRYFYEDMEYRIGVDTDPGPMVKQ